VTTTPSLQHASRIVSRVPIHHVFVRRPVLAIVVNLGDRDRRAHGFRALNVRQYPSSESATITVRTA